MEVGPYRLKDNHTLEYNEGSWDEFANMLFVDQPVGTGFSYVNTDSYLHELDEMSAQFIIFLEKFFQLFPEYEQDDVHYFPVFCLSFLRILTLTPADLYCRRIVCRSTYTLHRQRYSRSEQANDHHHHRDKMEPPWSPTRKCLGLPEGSIPIDSAFRLRGRTHPRGQYPLEEP